MGFGLLFLGILISANPVYAGFTDFFAYLLIYAAAAKLGVYNKQLRTAKIFSCAALLIAAGELALNVLRYTGALTVAQYDAYFYPVSLAMIVAELLFQLFMLLGIRALAKETELPKIEGGALWCVVLGVLNFLLTAFTELGGALAAEGSRLSGIVYITRNIGILYGVIYTLIFAFLVYRCYMWICMPGDEDMPVRESKFEFVNKLRAELDEKERRGNKR